MGILYYNKLYNKIIYLDLNMKSLEAATKRCSENGYCMNYEKKILEKYLRRGSFLFHRHFFEGICSWTNLENFTEQLFSEVLFFFQNTSQWLLLKLWNTYSKEILRTIKTTYFKFIYKEFKSYTKRNIYQKR